MPAQKISSWLASGELQTFSRKAQRLADLQRVFLESAPPSLAAASRVKNHRAGTLFLLADNAAVATKLKQLAPRLLINLQKRVPEITGIRVEVQVKEPPIKLRTGITKRPLTAETIENFRKLSDALPASPLKSALTGLVRRHRQSRPRS
jgi:hypothetical protein